MASPDLGGVQLRVRDEGGVDVDDHVQDAQGEGAVDGSKDAKHVHSWIDISFNILLDKFDVCLCRVYVCLSDM